MQPLDLDQKLQEMMEQIWLNHNNLVNWIKQINKINRLNWILNDHLRIYFDVKLEKSQLIHEIEKSADSCMKMIANL